MTVKNVLLLLLYATMQLNAMNSLSIAPDKKTYKKLYNWCQYCKPETIKEFLTIHPNIDINYQNKKGETCALHAAYHQNWDVVCYLVKHCNANVSIPDNLHQTLFSQALYGTYEIPKQTYCRYHYRSFNFPLKRLLQIYTPAHITSACKNLPLPSKCYSKKHHSSLIQTITKFIEQKYKLKPYKWQTNEEISSTHYKKIQEAILHSINKKYIPVTIELLKYDSRRLTFACYNSLFHYPDTLFILREFFTKNFDYHKMALLLTIFPKNQSNNTIISSFNCFPSDIMQYIKIIFLHLIDHKPLFIQTTEESKIEQQLWNQVSSNILWEKIDTNIWKKIQPTMGKNVSLNYKDPQCKKYILDHLLQLPPEKKTELNIELLMTSNIYVDNSANNKLITKYLYELY